MNMQSIMAQAQKMQKEINNKKEELERMSFTGKSQWVEVTFNGAKVLQDVKILKRDGFSPEDIDILEDMFQIAVKDAFIKINNEMVEKLGQYAGVLDGLM